MYFATVKEKVLPFLCFEVWFITRKMKDTRINGPEENKTNKREILPLIQHPRNLLGGEELLIYLFSLESGEGSDLEGLVKSGIKSRQITRESLWISWSIDSIIHVQAWIERLVDIVRTSFLSQLSYTLRQLHFFFKFWRYCKLSRSIPFKDKFNQQCFLQERKIKLIQNPKSSQRCRNLSAEKYAQRNITKVNMSRWQSRVTLICNIPGLPSICSSEPTQRGRGFDVLLSAIWKKI